MKRRRLMTCLCLLVVGLFAQTANADPIVYTMSVTDNGTTLFGDPQGVTGFLIDNDSVSYSKLIDAMTSTLMAAANSGTVLDLVEFVGFDGAVSPALMIGTYTFTDVLFLSLSLNGTAEFGSFVAEKTTFTQIPEPGTISLLLLAGLPLVWRVYGRMGLTGRRAFELDVSEISASR